MPHITEEFIKGFLPRLEVLVQTGNIVVVKTDDGQHIIAEMWHFPERAESDPENEYEIYPIAKIVTDAETAELKLSGDTPEP